MSAIKVLVYVAILCICTAILGADVATYRVQGILIDVDVIACTVSPRNKSETYMPPQCVIVVTSKHIPFKIRNSNGNDYIAFNMCILNSCGLDTISLTVENFFLDNDIYSLRNETYSLGGRNVAITKLLELVQGTRVYYSTMGMSDNMNVHESTTTTTYIPLDDELGCRSPFGEKYSD